MIGNIGVELQRLRAQELGLRIPETPRCRSCGGVVVIQSYIVTRPEYGTCSDCGAEWADDEPRGELCAHCGYSKLEDAEGRGGCLPATVQES